MKKRLPPKQRDRRADAAGKSAEHRSRSSCAESSGKTVDRSPKVATQRRTLSDRFGSGARLGADGGAGPNRTGLPGPLKSGVERLSGVSMDGVRVHYDSPEPARVDAAAFAQGRDIHVGPGQERHLPHESWHVVQQAQGRVRPTKQMANGRQINDDRRLETEADVMGRRAESLGAGGADAVVARERAVSDAPVQRAIGLEKETRIKVGPADATRSLGYPTIADEPFFRIDLDRDPVDKAPIIEMVIKHFDETAGSLADANRELTRRVEAAWAWVKKIAALTEGTKLVDAGVQLLPGYGDLVRRAGHSMRGVIHITVGVRMQDAPDMFRYISRRDVGGPSSWAGLRLANNALEVGTEFEASLPADTDANTRKELQGYMTYVANQIMTFNDSSYIKEHGLNVGLRKNLFLALGRVPMKTILESLSPASRGILNARKVDEFLAQIRSKYTPYRYGADKNRSTFAEGNQEQVVRNLIAFAFHGVGTFNVRENIGLSTVVPAMDVRANADKAAAVELRKVAAGIVTTDESETLDGVVKAAHEIIRQSRANWGADQQQGDG